MTEDVTPRNIEVNRHSDHKVTRVVSSFLLGFKHQIKYERWGNFAGEVYIELDGKEIFRESLISTSFGKINKTFVIEGMPIGQIRITGLGLVMSVKVLISGVDVLST